MPKKEERATRSGKKFPLLILIILLMFLGICAIGTYAYVEISKIKSQATNAKDDNSQPATVEIAAPVYLNLDAFTVSLKPEEEDDNRVLYIGLTLKLENIESRTKLEEYLPEVRSHLLVLFSQQTAAELSGDEAKSVLATKIKDSVNASIAEQKTPMVTNVLFNAFILR